MTCGSRELGWGAGSEKRYQNQGSEKQARKSIRGSRPSPIYIMREAVQMQSVPPTAQHKQASVSLVLKSPLLAGEELPGRSTEEVRPPRALF